ncbi:hypothetical protein [Cryobacterium arcticum]|uniref:Uncharacterized protein n=1 Tax=Cryobacterium arcticum TaxID=670052 RepID=A0A1B1BLP7_9MICO|nr:hypothetical protein [Cryobacterium arcticum]ANP73540.1 hypothetical protein PA27867_2596 [Cryobacterium arcticum]
MNQITPLQVVRDHLALSPQFKNERPRKLGVFIVLVFIATAVAATVWLLGIETDAMGSLLTATSIMTGLVFTMAMRFWERSLDARSDPDLIFDEKRRNTLDDMKTLLLWTVFAGIVSTAFLAGVAINVGAAKASAWTTGVAAGLISYQLLYVSRALLSLYSSSYTLRR